MVTIDDVHDHQADLYSTEPRLVDGEEVDLHSMEERRRELHHDHSVHSLNLKLALPSPAMAPHHDYLEKKYVSEIEKDHDYALHLQHEALLHHHHTGDPADKLDKKRLQSMDRYSIHDDDKSTLNDSGSMFSHLYGTFIPIQIVRLDDIMVSAHTDSSSDYSSYY